MMPSAKVVRCSACLRNSPSRGNNTALRFWLPADALVELEGEDGLVQRISGRIGPGAVRLTNDEGRLREFDREYLIYDHPKPGLGGIGPQLLLQPELLDLLAALVPPPRLNYLGVLARTTAYRNFSLRP